MHIGIMTAARLKQRQTLLLRDNLGWNIPLPEVMCQTCSKPIQIGAVYVSLERKHSPIRHGDCAVKVGLIMDKELQRLTNEKLYIREQ